jgi:hypothetical protein
VNRATVARWRLLIAAALFLGWISWLSYSAVVKNRGPVVSRAQAAAASQPVVAEVAAGPEGKPDPRVKVAEAIAEASPTAGTEIYVTNLPDAKGFEGPGQYLLLLNPDVAVRTVPVDGKELHLYTVVGLQRSPGYEMAVSGSPAMIYRMTEKVHAQVKQLYP